MRVGILLVVSLSTALELGCAARGQQVAMPKSLAAVAAPSTNSTPARDPFKKLREALKAAKRKGPPPPRQAIDQAVDVHAEARPEGTSGEGLAPLPTAAAPAAETSVPGAPDEGKTSAYASRPESRSVRNLLIRNLLIIALVATGLLLAFGILSRRPSR